MRTASLKTRTLRRSGTNRNINVTSPDHTLPQTNCLMEAAWNFSYSALWNDTLFSTKEITAAKARILEYLLLARCPRKAFIAFCQRVLLARYACITGKARMLSLPSEWLDRANAQGFVSTREWLQEIKAVRESLPGYKQEIKALAEAVLEFAEEPTIQNYQYWRSYFIEKGTPGLLNLFQVTAIQQLCN